MERGKEGKREEGKREERRGKEGERRGKERKGGEKMGKEGKRGEKRGERTRCKLYLRVEIGCKALEKWPLSSLHPNPHPFSPYTIHTHLHIYTHTYTHRVVISTLPFIPASQD